MFNFLKMNDQIFDRQMNMYYEYVFYEYVLQLLKQYIIIV